MSVSLNWTGHTPQEVELELQEEEFIELQFKEIQGNAFWEIKHLGLLLPPWSTKERA